MTCRSVSLMQLGVSLAIAVAGVAAAAGCSSGSSGEDQAQFEQQLNAGLTGAGGEYSISWDLPIGGGALNSPPNYLVAAEIGDQNVACGSTVKVTPFRSSLALSLEAPGLSTNRVVLNGQIRMMSSQGTFQLTCSSGGFIKDYIADDEQTVLYSLNLGNYTTVPLSGLIANSPEELLANVPLEDWINDNLFSANASWVSGATFSTHGAAPVADYVLTEDCPSSQPSGTTTPTPCGTGVTLDSYFPNLLTDSDGKPTEWDEASDGQISTVQGMRMWTANLPLPAAGTASYRVYYELGGNVYIGTLYKEGQPIVYSQADGTRVAYSVALNVPAVLSISNNFISGGAAGPLSGSDAELGQTADLFGLGGHGINGALAPQDLAQHYSLPTGLTGNGQTIVVVDAPGSGDFLADLNVMSQYYGLPTLQTCPASSGPCFKQIDLSNGSTGSGSSDWGTEVALDLQSAHAVAPGANLILVTAASQNADDLVTAIDLAATQDGVTVVSMSFGGTFDDTSGFDQDIGAMPGVAFVASSGDEGNQSQTGYPAGSPNVTAVGGTRIRALSWSSTGSETAWLFSGGGAPAQGSMPSWQTSYLTPTLVSENQNLRAVPDVAAVADSQNSPFAIYVKQHWLLAGGTSLSAPLWAGFTALLGESMVTNNHRTLASALAAAGPNGGGFNSMLYAAKTAAGTSVFHDIVSGSDNLGAESCPLCQSGAGYNDVTGLGVPDVSALITQLLSQAH